VTSSQRAALTAVLVAVQFHGPSGAAGRLPDGHRPYGHLLPGGWHRGAATAEAPRRVKAVRRAGWPGPRR